MATKNWVNIVINKGVVQSQVILNSGDTSDDLVLPSAPDKTIHIFGGTFGDATVSVKGSNNQSATFQNIHRTDDATLTYTAVAADLLGHMLENPGYIRATCGGTTGSGIIVSIISATQRG